MDESVWVTSTHSTTVSVTGLPPIGRTPVLLKGEQAKTAQVILALSGSPLRKANPALDNNNEALESPEHPQLSLVLDLKPELEKSIKDHPASGK